jgi:heme/copper-type cytochrome/quinol oxidase subunit 2
MNPTRIECLGIFAIFNFLFILGLIVLTVYLMIRAILFFKRKTQNDRELLNKIDKLIELHAKQENEPKEV